MIFRGRIILPVPINRLPEFPSPDYSKFTTVQDRCKKVLRLLSGNQKLKLMSNKQAKLHLFSNRFWHHGPFTKIGAGKG
jgi:hypothetical protein